MDKPFMVALFNGCRTNNVRGMDMEQNTME